MEPLQEPSIKRLSLLTTAASLLACSILYIRAIPLFNARFGNSGLDYFSLKMFPENFQQDFPTQLIAFHTSIVSHAFTTLGAIPGITPEAVGAGLIILQFAALAGLAVCILRLFRPQAPSTMLAITILCMTASNMRARDLAFHSHPKYLFFFYVLAYCLECAGLVYALRKKPMPAYLLLSSAFVVHPGIGSGGGLVGTAILLFGHGPQWRKLLPAGGLALCLCGIWAWLTMDLGAMTSSTGITMLDWQQYVGLGGLHFFPIRNGLLTDMHHTAFTPFLILLGLGVLSASQLDMGRFKRPVLAGLLAVLCISGLSLLHSMHPISIALLKLNLHRTTHIVQIFALVLVCVHAYDCITTGPWYKALPAALLLGFAFLPTPGIPLLWALLFAAGHAWGMVRSRRLHAGTLVALVLLGAAFAWAAVLGSPGGRWGGLVSGISIMGQTHPLHALLPGLLFLGVVVVRLRPAAQVGIIPVVALVALAVLGVLNSHQQTKHYSAPFIADYKDVQHWAASETDPKALFMLPPDIYYGWRAYSRRSSFGNIRDWLYSWGYTSLAEARDEGIRRAREFRVPLHEYTRPDSDYQDFRQLRRALGNAYHDKGESWFAHMSRTYEIDYFIFDKRRLDSRPLAKTVYENDSLLVCAAPPGNGAQTE